MMGVVSCEKEAVIPTAEEKVLIDFSTRGLLPAGVENPDNAITSVRVMAFYHSNGQFVEGSYRKIEDDQTTPPVSLQMKLNIGHYDFVFIVNEDSDGSRLKNILDNYTGKTLSDLHNEYFSSSAFRNDYSVPMTNLIKDVLITGDNKLTVGGTSVTTPWAIEVQRTGIRVDLFMQTTLESIVTGYSKLQIANVPDKVYLFDTNLNNGAIYNVTGIGSFEPSVPLYRQFGKAEGDEYTALSQPGDDGVSYTIIAGEGQEFVQIGATWYWYKRLILPETAFSATGTESLGMQLQAFVGGETYTLTLSDQSETDFTIPRNSRYRVNGVLKGNYIEFSVSIKPWGENTDVEIPLS